MLGCHRRRNGYIEGPEYIVTWAMGHLIELAEPAACNQAYKRWTLGSLPMLPNPMKHQVIPRTKDQFAVICELCRRRDVTDLVIATDAGREGELVARWIIQEADWDGTVRRLWISSQTDSAISQGFRDLKPGSAYEHLFRAAETRAEADWIVDMNDTRALTCRYDTPLSAGRVQTPTLAILVHREDEIESFSGAACWTVKADFSGILGSLRDTSGSARIASEEQAQEITDALKGAAGRVLSLERSPRDEPPPLAYDLTELQRDANIRLGFSAKHTLDVLQQLYERHKIVTYPKTDCRYDSLKLTIEAAGHRFEAKAVEMKHLGWKQITGVSDDGIEELADHASIADLKEGDALAVASAEMKRELTRPPARYTEATLLSAMVHAGRFIEDTKLKRSISGSGIGTPATRADIIEKLLSKYYVEREDRYLKPTAKGRELIRIAPEELRSAELTARWEERLAAIADGLERPEHFSRDIRKRTEELVEDIRRSKRLFSPDYRDAPPCPVCGGAMMKVQGKEKQEITACQSLSCGYEEIDGKPTKKVKAMERRAVKQFDADRSDPGTTTFADLIKASQQRKEKKRRS